MHGFDDAFRQAAIRLRGMWTYRWLGLGVAWAVGLLGIAAMLAVPARYEATARIFVNTDSILKPLMTGLTVQPNDEQRITMLSRVVISRPNVERLVREVGLDGEARTKEERERVVDGVMKTLEFRGDGRDNLYTLSFRDVDPARAKRAVEILANTFIDSSKGGKSEDTEAAKTFIDEQIAVYDKKLRDAENRMKEFRLRYLGMTPGEGRDFLMQMADAERQLTQARLELREAERARDAYRRGLAGEEAAPGAVAAPDPAITDVDARIDAMRR
ncbi:MAG TPA: chain length-determining protein, partial [Usitatibacter sp.]|nr:chain length-determining protein [Usitatibacter sp.]